MSARNDNILDKFFSIHTDSTCTIISLFFLWINILKCINSFHFIILQWNHGRNRPLSPNIALLALRWLLGGSLLVLIWSLKLIRILFWVNSSIIYGCLVSYLFLELYHPSLYLFCTHGFKKVLSCIIFFIATIANNSCYKY